MTQLDITKAAKDYRDIQSMIKELENEAEGIKARLTAHMDAQGADTIQAGSFTDGRLTTARGLTPRP